MLLIRILQSVNIMDRAGLETMLMNYYRNIDRDVVQFDFLTHRDFEGAYDDEIRTLGGKIYHAPRLYPQHLSSYYKYMRKLFCEHREYRIIHSHMDSMSYFPLKAAKLNGIPIRIAHSHTSKLDFDLKFPIKYYALKSLTKVANYNIACGKIAGKFLFHDSQFGIVHNAIDLSKFAFDEEIRKTIRNKLNIQNCFVIGHVGRFCYIKNQLFLVEILKEVLKYRPNSILALVGKGPDERKIREKAKKLGVENNVLFLIDRADVAELYQAFDIFVMPSLFEGLPVVGVESQANGLPVIISDKVSSEIMITNNISQLSLKNSASEWANCILTSDCKRNNFAFSELQKAGYDIKNEAMNLQNFYVDLYNKI